MFFVVYLGITKLDTTKDAWPFSACELINEDNGEQFWLSCFQLL